MARFDLTDFEWSVIRPLLPTKVCGKARADNRRVLNGIFWRLRTGAPWADIPSRYGPYTTCVNRSNRWRRAGHWARILEAVLKAYDGDIQMIDSSSIRVHQHAANSKKDERSRCMGRSRGGLTTKIHALVDAEGRPIHLKLTAGQAHDGRSANDMLTTVGEGNILLADRAYDSDRLRKDLQSKWAWTLSVPCQDGSKLRDSVHGSIKSAMLLNGSSIKSSISEQSQPDTTSETITSWLPYSSLQFVCGCVIMSRLPSIKKLENAQ